MILSVPYRITIRVSEDTMRKLEELVESYNFESVSDVVRKAIQDLIQRNETGKARKMDISISKRVLENLNREVTDESPLSLDDLVKAVLREYTSRVLNEEVDKLTGNKKQK
ncbi:MAG: ribbon-helix-helix domain-containing protein [Thermoplasmataceae archaeon]